MSYELTGPIKVIMDTQTFPSGFSKREFVVTLEDGKYPQDIKLEVVKERTTELDQFNAGQTVKVQFDLRGNEYNGKFYVNLVAWRLEAVGGGGAGSAPPADDDAAFLDEPPPGYDAGGDDDIPF